MTQVRVQLGLTLVWAALFVPALLFWQDSVPFLVFVSVYANFVGHLSAWEAARAKESGLDDSQAEEVVEGIRDLRDGDS